MELMSTLVDRVVEKQSVKSMEDVIIVIFNKPHPKRLFHASENVGHSVQQHGATTVELTELNVIL